MGIAHLDTTFLELLPDRAVVDAEVLADASERLACGVELLCLVDLASRETSLANLDALALQDGRDRRGVDPEVFGQFEGSPTSQILATEVSSFFAGQALGARCWSCYNWTWN